MEIRKAKQEDSKAIATCLLLAMEAIICQFLKTTDVKIALKFLNHFTSQPNNQYSYQNCFVAVIENKIIGALNIYDGAKLEELRKPISDYIKLHYNKNFKPEDETQAGEFYIDSFGIAPQHQGKGLGKQLLNFVIKKYVVEQSQTVGLLVEEANSSAERLYKKSGFQKIGTKILVGKQMHHLQIKP